MDKNTFKVLKFIGRKGKSISYDKVVKKLKHNKFPNVDESINTLNYDNMISIEHLYESGRIVSLLDLTITGKGKEYIESEAKQNLHFMIPTIISIIALIGAYRKELLWLLQEIMKLLI